MPNSPSKPPVNSPDAEPPVVDSQPILTASVVTPNKSANRSFASSVMQSRVAVLCILFFATAALGIPLLWRSPAFSQKERIIWSIIITIYTSIIFWIFYEIMAWSWRQISPMFA